METIPKPDELLALHGITAELFDTLKRRFEVDDQVTLRLDDIDAAVTELGDPQMIAAMAMRKLQALRLLAQPGVQTTTDVIVAIIQDLDRALLQAPSMWLKRAAATTDWDAAFAELVDQGPDAPAAAADTVDAGTTGAPDDAGAAGLEEEDPEVVRFREQHAGLHLALRAVLEASDGEIRVLE